MDDSERSRLEAALNSKMHAVLAQHDKRMCEIFAKVRERVVEINQACGKKKFGLGEVKSKKEDLEAFFKDFKTKRRDVAARLEKLLTARYITSWEEEVTVIRHNVRLKLEALAMEKSAIEEYKSYQKRAENFEELDDDVQGTLVDELEPLEKKVAQLLRLANEKLDCSIEPRLIGEYQSRDLEPHWSDQVQVPWRANQLEEPHWSDLIGIARKRRRAQQENLRVPGNTKGKEPEIARVIKKPQSIIPKELATANAVHWMENLNDDKTKIVEDIRHSVRSIIRGFPIQKLFEHHLLLSSSLAQTAGVRSSTGFPGAVVTSLNSRTDAELAPLKSTSGTNISGVTTRLTTTGPITNTVANMLNAITSAKSAKIAHQIRTAKSDHRLRVATLVPQGPQPNPAKEAQPPQNSTAKELTEQEITTAADLLLASLTETERATLDLYRKLREEGAVGDMIGTDSGQSQFGDMGKRFSGEAEKVLRVIFEREKDKLGKEVEGKERVLREGKERGNGVAGKRVGVVEGGKGKGKEKEDVSSGRPLTVAERLKAFRERKV